MIDDVRSILYPLGLLSSLAFGLRFAIQWYTSEKAQRSVVPALFWKLSIVGNFFALIHALIQIHFPLCLVQSLQTVLSWRNLNLLQPKEQHIAFKKVIYLLFGAAFISVALFVAQGYFLENGGNYWLRSPHSMGAGVMPVEVPLFIHAIGIFGIIAFSLRFWIQWLQAERDEKSELTKTFWWLSILGASLSAFYFVMLYDWVNLIGPLVAIVPYSRNLYLIKKRDTDSPASDSIFVFAGEKSGDLCGAKLIQELKNTFPHHHFFGVGGKEMEKAGLTLLYPMERFQVMGFSDVLKSLPTLIVSMISLKKIILKRKPILCLFIDQPDFSMKLAKRLRQGSFKGKIVQFVAPSVWAWRKNRAEEMAKHFDLLLTLFSFEPEYFSKTSLKTIWAGHPIVETIMAPQSLDDKPLIAIFPGSRPAEITRNLPKQLEAAFQFCKKAGKAFEIAVSGSSSASLAEIEEMIASLQKREPAFRTQKVTIVPFDKRYELMQRSTIAIAKCGTVNLELALHEVPTVVTYELSTLNRFLATYILKIDLPYYSIVNILKKKELFSELIKKKIGPQDIEEKLFTLYTKADLYATCKLECRELASLVQREKKPTLIACEAIVETIYDR